MADPQTLDELTAQYQRARQKEIKQGFQRAMAGLTRDPNIMAAVREQQRDLSTADRAALRTEVTEQMAELQKGRAFDSDLIKELLKSATTLSERGIISATEMGKLRFAAEAGKELAAISERKQALRASAGVDWSPYVEGTAANSGTFNKILDEAVMQAQAEPPGVTGSWAETIGGAVTRGLERRHIPMLIGALQERMGWSAFQAEEEAKKASGGIGLYQVYSDELNRLDTINAEMMALEEQEQVLLKKSEELGRGKMSKDAANLVSALLGGDAEAFSQIVETLGGQAVRAFTPEEEETYKELKSTLEYLESGSPDSGMLRDKMMKDPRFLSWAENQGYDNPEEAFRIWIKNAKIQLRRTKRDTKRQEQINAAVGAAPGVVKGAIGRLRTPAEDLQEAALATKKGYQPKPGKSTWMEDRRRKRYLQPLEDEAGRDPATKGFEDTPEPAPTPGDSQASALKKRRNRVLNDDITALA